VLQGTGSGRSGPPNAELYARTTNALVEFM
jgi:hypothetical protein